MKRFARFSAFILALLLVVSSFALFTTAQDPEDGALAVDTSTVQGTAGNAGEGIDMLFDANPSTKYCTMNNQAEIWFALTEPAVVTYYEMTAAEVSARDPKSWILWGSNDGEDWTDLDVQEDQNFLAAATTLSFEFENDTAYLWYKLDILENHGTDPYGLDILALADLALYTAKPGEVEEEGFHVLLDSIEATECGYGHVVTNLFTHTDAKYLVDNFTSAYVKFQLSKSVVINSYAFTTADRNDRNPVSWTLYGSATGADGSWTLLDSRADEALIAATHTYSFDFENETEYAFYKFEFTKNNGGSMFALDEIELSYVEPGIVVDEGVEVDTSTITSSEGFGGNVAIALFDEDAGSKFLSADAAPFVQFALKSAKAINSYTMTSATDWAARHPSAWILYASNDAENWVKLDERTGESPKGLAEDHTFVFVNDTEYLWYKLVMTARNCSTKDAVSPPLTGFAELKLEIVDEPALFTHLLTIDPASVVAPDGTSNNGVANLIDNDGDTRYLVNQSSIDVVFRLTKPAPVNRYSVVGSKDHLERSPKTFAFYGSLDGENWVELDRRDLEAKTASDSSYYCGEAYEFENNTVYTYYKLSVEAVSSGSYTAMSKLNVFTASPAEGLDVYVPAGVSDLTGVAEAAILKSVTYKGFALDAESADAINAAGPVTFYYNVPAEGTDAVSAAFAGKANVELVNLLAVYEPIKVETVDGKKRVTTIFEILSDDLAYDDMQITLTFAQAGQTVRTFTKDIKSVYLTVRGVASVNEASAAAAMIQHIDAAYLAGVIVQGIPDGTYELTVSVSASTDNGNGGTVTVTTGAFVCEI